MGTKTWDGGATGNWNVSSNWSPAGVPVTGDDVVINTAGCTVTLDVHIGGGQTNTGLGSLTITAGTLQTNDGSNRMLKVTGTTQITGTLNCTGSDMFLGSGLTSGWGLDIQSGGTFTGGTGTHTIGSIFAAGGGTRTITLSSGATTIDSKNTGNGFTINLASGATFNHGSGTVTMTYAGNTLIQLSGGTLAFNTFTYNASGRTLELRSPMSCAGNLTLTAGTLDTKSGTNHALTVTGDTQIDGGTLTCNASTINLRSGGSGNTWGLRLNSGTFNGGTGTHNIGGLRVQGGTFVWSDGTTTLNGGETSSSASTLYKTSSGTFTVGTGTVVVDTSSTLQWLLYGGDISVYNLTIASGSTLRLWQNTSDGTAARLLTVAGDLTATGDLTTKFGSQDDVNLTVTGTVTLTDGDLLLNASEVTIGGFSVTGDGEMTGTTHANGLIVLGNWRSAGSRFNNADGKVVFKGTSGGTIAMNGAGSTGDGFYDLEINIAGQTYTVNEWDLTGIERNLTITAGTLSTGSNLALTVTGTTTIGPASGVADQATLTCNASTISLGTGRQQADYALNIEIGGTFVGGTGTHTVGSLYMAQSANAKATMTTGVMTINGYNNSANKAWRVEYGGDTFDNANGTVRFNFNGFDTRMSMRSESHANNAFHNLIIQMNGDTRTLSIDNGTDVKVDNDLTVSRGVLNAGSNHNLEVVGHVDVGTDSEVSNLKFTSTSTKTATFGSLTIGADGIYEATSGTTTINLNFRFEDGANFTHNSGTVTFAGATDANLEMEGGHSGRKTPTNPLKFHNLTSAKTGNYLNLYVDFTVESTFTITTDSTYGVSVRQPVYLTMGTATAQGTIAGPSSGTDNLYFATEATTSKILAANTDGLYPWIKTGNDWGWSAGNGGTINLENGDYQTTLNTETGYQGQSSPGDNTKTIKLTGDMKFAAVTVGSGDTLDLNGQRVEFGGIFQNNGAMKSTGGGLIIAHNNVRMGGSAEGMHDGDVNMIVDGGTAQDWRNGAADGAAPWCRNVFINGNCTSGDAIGPGSGYSFYNPESVIIGNGSLNINDNIYLKNLTIATGGTLTAGNARIHDLYGDFTMSGGLIGLSALSFPDGGNSPSGAGNYLDVPYDLVNLTGDATIEFWMKAAANTNDASRGIINGYKGGTANRWQLYQTTSNNMTFYSHDYNKGITVTCPTGEWTHVAIVCTGTGGDAKLYINGKLEGQTELGSGVSLATSGAFPDFGVNRQLDSTDLRTGTRLFEGNLAMLRIWTDERTQSELRANMFATYANLASNTSCAIAYEFDEGTGTDVDDEVGSNNGTLVNVTWAGAGTYDKTEGPTLIMAGVSGGGSTAQNINVKNGADIYNLTIDDAVTASVHTIDNSAGVLDIYGNLTVNEKLTSSASSNTSGIRMKTAATTLTVASDVKTTALATLYQVVLDHGGTTEIDEMNLKVVELQSGATLKATGDFTVTTELEVGGACTLNANGKTLTCKLLDMNGTGTLNLVGSTLILSSTDGLTSTSNTILNGGPGTTVSGSLAATTFESQNNFAIVGKIENLDVTNQELNVMGQVINCTGDIIQQHQTQDSAQQLDYDTADDRDVMLGRDLDKNTELVG